MRKQTKTFSTLSGLLPFDLWSDTFIAFAGRLIRIHYKQAFVYRMCWIFFNLHHISYIFIIIFFFFWIRGVIYQLITSMFASHYGFMIPITWREYSRRPSVGFCQRALRFIVTVLRPFGTTISSSLRIRCVSPKYQLNTLRTPATRNTSAFTLFWSNSCAKLSYQFC